ncbi:hypothetical protein [Enterococcus devriesei]|uniref:hypothetical protein n=1 Tax=Enterococcus devriesei TaxID=319970 RepID=UPI0036D38CA1
MNTYMKIQNTETQEYFHVSLNFSDHQLILVRSQGMKRPLTEILQLADISSLVFDEFLGSPIISFFYKNRRYTFYESGPAVTEYLKENLAA